MGLAALKMKDHWYAITTFWHLNWQRVAFITKGEGGTKLQSLTLHFCSIFSKERHRNSIMVSCFASWAIPISLPLSFSIGDEVFAFDLFFFLINNIPSFIVYYFTKYYFSRNKTAHTFAICIFIVHSLIFSMWMGSNASFFFFFLFWSLNFFLLWLDPSLTRLKARDFNFVKRGKNWKTPIKWISKLIQKLKLWSSYFPTNFVFFKKKNFWFKTLIFLFFSSWFAVPRKKSLDSRDREKKHQLTIIQM